jgi:putative ABC transport system substrate-binding protein
MKIGMKHEAIGNRKRVYFLGFVVCALFFALSFVADAQQAKKVPRIGYATGGAMGNVDPYTNAFRGRLKELGYIEGKNIKIEYRISEGKGPAVEAEQARELVRLNVDVIVAGAYPSIRAAKEATKTIPIVMVTTQDPVAIGLINSLAHPGGNVTGVSQLARELSGKRLELFSELVPNLSRVALLLLRESIGRNDALKAYQEAARALKLELRAVEIRADDPDVPRAFDAAMSERARGMIPIRNGTINRLVPRIAEIAIKNRLPTMFERHSAVENGGLASYTADELEGYRRAAVYLDKILKGAKPADLPVEQPTKFEFAINLKTAQQIGLTVPPNVLARANRVIR